MAVVFQEYDRSLFPWMRVRQNVKLPLKNQGVPKAERDWKKLGVTVLFVTHDIDESVYLGERVIILSSCDDDGGH